MYFKIFSILQTCKETTDPGALQKAEDFVRSFALGFEIEVDIHMPICLMVAPHKVIPICFMLLLCCLCSVC